MLVALLACGFVPLGALCLALSLFADPPSAESADQRVWIGAFGGGAMFFGGWLLWNLYRRSGRPSGAG